MSFENRSVARGQVPVHADGKLQQNFPFFGHQWLHADVPRE